MLNKYFIPLILLFFLLIIIESYTQPPAITLGWTPNMEPDLSHYVMHRDTIPGTMAMLAIIPKIDSTYTDTQVEPGKAYYYKLTAVDSSGNESEPSNEVMGTADDPLPIQLGSFAATPTGQGYVLLEWVTLTETNNYGFEVQRRPDSDPQYQTMANSFIPGHGTTLEPHYYSYTDSTVTLRQWWYRLKQIDLDGTVHYTDVIHVDLLTDADEEPLPTAFSLEQNYPNPFNPTTTMTYNIPIRSEVRMIVYDLLGKEVRTLVDDYREPGSYEVRWDGKDNGGVNVLSGTYFYQIIAGDYGKVRKSILQK